MNRLKLILKQQALAAYFLMAFACSILPLKLNAADFVEVVLPPHCLADAFSRILQESERLGLEVKERKDGHLVVLFPGNMPVFRSHVEGAKPLLEEKEYERPWFPSHTKRIYYSLGSENDAVKEQFAELERKGMKVVTSRSTLGAIITEIQGVKEVSVDPLVLPSVSGEDSEVVRADGQLSLSIVLMDRRWPPGRAMVMYSPKVFTKADQAESGEISLTFEDLWLNNNACSRILENLP